MRSSILGLVVVVVSGCGGVMGNGKVVSDERTVGAFRTVTIASGFTAMVKPGARAVTIHADENLLSYLETEVRGDSLVVDVKPDTLLAGVSALDVTIFNDVIEGLDASGGSQVDATATPIPTFKLGASGGSRVNLDSLSSTELDADASGGSHVTAAGTATSARAGASGGSIVDLTSVALATLEVTASGGSTVNASVTGSVAGSASGASQVTITGNPTVSVDRSGASTVTVHP